MNSMLAISFIITISILEAQANSASKPATSIPAHDIDTYEKAGPYERIRLPNGKLPADQLARIGRSRKWLWAHFQGQRRALLIETSHSIEGDRSTAYYFVEPDEQGHWRIATKIERILYNHKFKDAGCERFEVEQFISYSVTRVNLQPDENGLYRPIPSDEQRSPENYRLQFELEETGSFIYY
jgi:hypothetical protein